MNPDELRAPGTDDDEPWIVPGPDPVPHRWWLSWLAVTVVGAVLVVALWRRA